MSRELDHVTSMLTLFILQNESERLRLEGEVKRLREVGDNHLADRIQKDFLDPIKVS